jgi:cytochrome c oxidase accessory protein FixG
MSHTHLPVIQNDPEAEPADQRALVGSGSLGRDGRRRRPYPADVSGRWLTARRIVYAALIGLWVALPWIQIAGHPAVFLDIESRQFFLFGLTFNAQDVWLTFFLLTGVGFGLIYATAVLGRVWCGWACPQSVFLEAVFRPIERLINGSRTTALRRANKGGFEQLWRTLLTHAMYLIAAALVAHVFLAYFVSLPRLFQMVRHAPAAHPEAFAWMAVSTGIMYANFAFFREQLCVVICPYGRLQSVLLDDDSLVVGYDVKRGEPRGKGLARQALPAGAGVGEAGAGGAGARGAAAKKGDCVDCNRCVVVCPTAIDIREGLQLDCVACTACIDACDEVMDKVGQPRGLIRYDSLRGLRGEKRRILRPRLYGYTVLLVIGAVVASTAFSRREPFEANIVRLRGMPYTREGGVIRNAFEFHLVNKEGQPAEFDIDPVQTPGVSFMIPITNVKLPPLGSQHLPFFVTMEQASFKADQPFVIRVRSHSPSGKSVTHDARAVFLGARN